MINSRYKENKYFILLIVYSSGFLLLLLAVFVIISIAVKSSYKPFLFQNANKSDIRSKEINQAESPEDGKFQGIKKTIKTGSFANATSSEIAGNKLKAYFFYNRESQYLYNWRNEIVNFKFKYPGLDFFFVFSEKNPQFNEALDRLGIRQEDKSTSYFIVGDKHVLVPFTCFYHCHDWLDADSPRISIEEKVMKITNEMVDNIKYCQENNCHDEFADLNLVNSLIPLQNTLPFLPPNVSKDGGFDVYKKGYIDLVSEKVSDQCLDKKTLYEYSLSLDKLQLFKDAVECPLGCKDGACIKADYRCEPTKDYRACYLDKDGTQIKCYQDCHDGVMTSYECIDDVIVKKARRCLGACNKKNECVEDSKINLISDGAANLSLVDRVNLARELNIDLDERKEANAYDIYLKNFINDNGIKSRSDRIESYKMFVSYGADLKTKAMSEKERFMLLKNYYDTNKKLPESDSDFYNFLRSANGLPLVDESSLD